MHNTLNLEADVPINVVSDCKWIEIDVTYSIISLCSAAVKWCLWYFSHFVQFQMYNVYVVIGSCTVLIL